MSIWASLPALGQSDDEEDERAEVWSYVDGWSNRYPSPHSPDAVEHGAVIDLATIPPYCVPGHHGDADHPNLGPWLRVIVDSWEHDYHTPKERGGGRAERASIVMDEDAVRRFVEMLTEWLDRPKVHPAP